MLHRAMDFHALSEIIQVMEIGCVIYVQFNETQVVRWDNHNTEPANGILFFMEKGVVHQCFLTHKNHHEEW